MNRQDWENSTDHKYDSSSDNSNSKLITIIELCSAERNMENTYTGIEVIFIEINWIETRIEEKILSRSTSDHRGTQWNKISRDTRGSDADISWFWWY